MKSQNLLGDGGEIAMSREFFRSEGLREPTRFIIERFEHNMWSEYAVEELSFVVVHDEIGIEIVCTENWQANAFGNKILQYRHFEDLDSTEKACFDLVYSGCRNRLRLVGNLYNAFNLLKSSGFINSGFAKNIEINSKIKNLFEKTKGFEFHDMPISAGPEEISLDVPLANTSSKIKATKITYLKGEEAVKFYFVDEESYRFTLMHLELLLGHAVDDASEELHFMCKGKDEERSLLFVLDLSQALDVMKGYGVITEETRLKILEIVSPRELQCALLENEFNSSKVYVESLRRERSEERIIDVHVGRPTWKINRITYLRGEEKIKLYFHDQLDYDWMLIVLGRFFDPECEECFGGPKFNYQRNDRECSILFINDLFAALEWLLEQRLITGLAKWKILEVVSARELDNALLDKEFIKSRVWVSDLSRQAEIEENVKQLQQYTVKPWNIVGASLFSSGDLVLYFNSSNETEEFWKIFRTFTKMANIQLGKQHFTVLFFPGEVGVTLSGNFFNAFELIELFNLITASSLKKYIEMTDIVEFIRKSKSVNLSESMVLQSRKFGVSP